MSSQGLLRGFTAGWGMMNQHNQQEENKRRYEFQSQEEEADRVRAAKKYKTQQVRLDVQ